VKKSDVEKAVKLKEEIKRVSSDVSHVKDLVQTLDDMSKDESTILLNFSGLYCDSNGHRGVSPEYGIVIDFKDYEILRDALDLTPFYKKHEDLKNEYKSLFKRS